MQRININFKWIPEFYFILISILWYFVTVNPQNNAMGEMANFPALILIVLFHIQLFLNDPVLGKSLSLLASLGSFYLIYTLIQTLSNNYGFNYQSQIELLQMGNLIILNFIMSYWMYIKYDGFANSKILADISTEE